MGILNATPDSFSDGGKHFDSGRAIEVGLRMLDEGADILDVGGESTRPGAAAVAAENEIARVVPILAGLRKQSDAPLSIDTMKPAVARAAFDAGAAIWNDVMGLCAPGALKTAADLGAAVIVMHMQGEPRTMQAAPRYDDVVREVGDFLAERAAACRDAGLETVWVDPGIGFGKTLEHNLALMRALPDLIARTSAPLAFGASRKSFIQKLDARASDPMDRLGGSLAAALVAARAGASIIRVHDVRATVQALRVQTAIEGTT
ncbi:MAG: dihydropteroate synthase [Alphaproteobacteria bacterium]|nr:dihydropteroate synthase [Alphaproteobacteria bacterium]